MKYFKCSDNQNCANLWILRQVRLLDNKKTKLFYIEHICTLNPYIPRDMLQFLLFIILSGSGLGVGISR